MNLNNSQSDITLTASFGPDTVINTAPSVTIDALDGNDIIENNSGGDFVSINAGKGNDYISTANSTKFVTIDAGSGNDSIYSAGSSVTIFAGDGSDSIDNRAAFAFVDTGNDDDYIRNLGHNVTIFASSGNNSIVNGSTSSSSSSLQSAYSIINAGSGNDSITNYSAFVTINAGSGFSHILNSGQNAQNVLINTSLASALVENSAMYVTVNGGSGNDTISDSTERVSLSAGPGDDLIILNGAENDTIYPGSGADTISLATALKNYIIYNSGDGDDRIIGLNSLDSIFVNAPISSALTDNKDVFLIIGEGSIYLQNQISAVPASLRPSLSSQDLTNYIANSINIYRNGSKLDINLVNIGADLDQSGLVTINADQNNSIKGKSGNDRITNIANRVTINSQSGADTIENRAAYVSINSGADNDSLSSSGSYVTLSSGSGNDSIQSQGSHVSINSGSDDDYIYNYYGDDVTITPGTGNDTIELGTFTNNALIQYANGDGPLLVKGFNVSDSLQITSGVYSTAKSGQDIIINVGSSAITLESAKKILEADLDINISGAASSQLNTLSADDTLNNPSAPHGGGLDTLDFTVTFDNPYPYITLGALFKGTLKASDYPSDTRQILAESTQNPIFIIGNSKNNTIFGGQANNTIDAASGNDIIIANSGDDSLSGGAGNDSLLGNAGNDSLLGGKGNDTLIGGAGADIFIYQTGDGNDVISDYTSGLDTIKIIDANITKAATVKGDNKAVDLTLTVGSGTIKLKEGAGKKISIIDKDDNPIHQTFGANYISIAEGDDNTYNSAIDAAVINCFFFANFVLTIPIFYGLI